MKSFEEVFCVSLMYRSEQLAPRPFQMLIKSRRRQERRKNICRAIKNRAPVSPLIPSFAQLTNETKRGERKKLFPHFRRCWDLTIRKILIIYEIYFRVYERLFGHIMKLIWAQNFNSKGAWEREGGKGKNTFASGVGFEETKQMRARRKSRKNLIK